MCYNWQHPQWPHFEYDLADVQDLLYDYSKEASALLGGLNQIPENMQTDAIIDLMVSEALSTLERGCVIKLVGGGRNTRYELALSTVFD